jgi:hypothetical protein
VGMDSKSSTKQTKQNKQRLLTLSQLESGCAHCARVSPWLLNKYTVLEGRLIEFFVALPSSAEKEHIERLATQNFYVKEPARSSIDSRSRVSGWWGWSLLQHFIARTSPWGLIWVYVSGFNAFSKPK